MYKDDWWFIWMDDIEPGILEPLVLQDIPCADNDNYPVGHQRHSSRFFEMAEYRLYSGEIDFLNSDIRIVLVDSSYTPTFSEQTIEDVSADSYAATGPVTLTCKSIDKGGNYDAADISWQAVCGANNIHGAIIFCDEGGELLAYAGFPSIAPNGGDVTLMWGDNGIFQIS